MQVIVSGKHLNVGEALRSYVEENVRKHIKKYFENAIHAHITISKVSSDAQCFCTRIIINEGTGTGIVIKSDAEEYDAYRSVEQAIHKMEGQLRRYKKRIKNHKKHKLTLNAVKYTISPFTNEETGEAQQDNYAPTIVAEQPVQVTVMSVSDAVMQMDLQNLSAYLFVNANNMHLNLVYYRRDGNIAWVDSAIKANGCE
ncbi:Ribosome hibernation promoting factor [Alphaproteobacteria bacterium]